MHRFIPPVTDEGYDGSHHPRYTECGEPVSTESEIVRVVSFSTTEISEITRLKSDFQGPNTLKLLASEQLIG